MECEFEGRTAIVTGAGSGIGSEIARKLGAQGARVVVADLNDAAADKVAAEIEGSRRSSRRRPPGRRNSESVRQSVELAMERFGGLHLAVNNAGIGGDQALVADYSLEDWDRVIAINLSGVFYGLKYRSRRYFGRAAAPS